LQLLCLSAAVFVFFVDLGSTGFIKTRTYVLQNAETCTFHRIINDYGKMQL